jgi:hypothetical protein
VGQGQPPLHVFLSEDYMVDSDRLDRSTICLPVGAADHHRTVAILGFQEPISQVESAPGGGCRGQLLGLEGFVEIFPQAAAYPEQVGMPQWVQRLPPFPSPSREVPPRRR